MSECGFVFHRFHAPAWFCVLCSVLSVLTIAVRYLLENMDWLEEELGEYEDDYLVFDCPGMLIAALRFYQASCLARPDRTLYASPVSANTSPQSE